MEIKLISGTNYRSDLDWKWEIPDKKGNIHLFQDSLFEGLLLNTPDFISSLLKTVSDTDAIQHQMLCMAAEAALYSLNGIATAL